MISVNDFYAQQANNQEIREKELINPCIELIDAELQKAIYFPFEIRCFLEGKGFAELYPFELEKIRKTYSLLGWDIKVYLLLRKDRWKWTRKFFLQYEEHVPSEFKLIFNLPGRPLIFWRRIKNYLFSFLKKDKFLLSKKIYLPRLTCILPNWQFNFPTISQSTPLLIIYCMAPSNLDWKLFLFNT